MKILFKASEEAKAIPSQEDLFDLMREVNCQQRALRKIKAYVDAVLNGKVTLITGNNDVDLVNHVYDVNVYLRSIQIFVREGLGLSNSNITKGRRKLE